MVKLAREFDEVGQDSLVNRKCAASLRQEQGPSLKRRKPAEGAG